MYKKLHQLAFFFQLFSFELVNCDISATVFVFNSTKDSHKKKGPLAGLFLFSPFVEINTNLITLMSQLTNQTQENKKK